DCFLDLADEATNARTASLVDCGTASDLAGRLFRRSCIGHVCLSSNSNQIPQPEDRVVRRPHVTQECGSNFGQAGWLSLTVGGHIPLKRAPVNAQNAKSADIPNP